MRCPLTEISAAVGGGAAVFFPAFDFDELDFFAFVPPDDFELEALTRGPWSWNGSFDEKIVRRVSEPSTGVAIAGAGVVVEGVVAAGVVAVGTEAAGVVAAAGVTPAAVGGDDWWSLLIVWYAKNAAIASSGTSARSIFFSFAAFARAASCSLLEAIAYPPVVVVVSVVEVEVVEVEVASVLVGVTPFTEPKT
jgi:hypothetical protein